MHYFQVQKTCESLDDNNARNSTIVPHSTPGMPNLSPSTVCNTNYTNFLQTYKPISIPDSQSRDMNMPSNRKHIARRHPYKPSPKELHYGPIDPSMYVPMSTSGEDVCFTPEFLELAK